MFLVHLQPLPESAKLAVLLLHCVLQLVTRYVFTLILKFAAILLPWSSALQQCLDAPEPLPTPPFGLSTAPQCPASMHTWARSKIEEEKKLFHSLNQLLLRDVELLIDSLDLLLVEADLLVLVLHLLLML